MKYKYIKFTAGGSMLWGIHELTKERFVASVNAGDMIIKNNYSLNVNYSKHNHQKHWSQCNSKHSSAFNRLFTEDNTYFDPETNSWKEIDGDES